MESNQQDTTGQAPQTNESAPGGTAAGAAPAGETTDQHINIKVKSQVSILPPLLGFLGKSLNF